MGMGQTASVWFVIALSLLAANLPFVSQRFLLLFPLVKGKTLTIRLLELIVFYFIVGGVGSLLEQRLGQRAPQNWEFYAITACLFITLSFPGFVWRYLLKHRE